MLFYKFSARCEHLYADMLVSCTKVKYSGIDVLLIQEMLVSLNSRYMQKSIGQRWTNRPLKLVPNSLPIISLENKSLNLELYEWVGSLTSLFAINAICQQIVIFTLDFTPINVLLGVFL